MKSFSHPATKQDIWVLNKVQNRPQYHPGIAVEVGAYDGLTHSNTRLLECHGWDCILIEALDYYADQCIQNRPLAQVMYGAVGGAVERNERFIIGEQYSGLERTMPDAFYREHNRRKSNRTTVKVQSLTSYIKDLHPTYLSVDTEGNEYEILDQWFRDGCRADLITVEFRYEAGLQMQFDNLFDQYDYVLDDVRGFDLCYVWKGAPCLL